MLFALWILNSLAVLIYFYLPESSYICAYVMLCQELFFVFVFVIGKVQLLHSPGIGSLLVYFCTV